MLKKKPGTTYGKFALEEKTIIGLFSDGNFKGFTGEVCPECGLKVNIPLVRCWVCVCGELINTSIGFVSKIETPDLFPNVNPLHEVPDEGPVKGLIEELKANVIPQWEYAVSFHHAPYTDFAHPAVKPISDRYSSDEEALSVTQKFLEGVIPTYTKLNAPFMYRVHRVEYCDPEISVDRYIVKIDQGFFDGEIMFDKFEFDRDQPKIEAYNHNTQWKNWLRFVLETGCTYSEFYLRNEFELGEEDVITLQKALESSEVGTALIELALDSLEKEIGEWGYIHKDMVNILLDDLGRKAMYEMEDDEDNRTPSEMDGYLTTKFDAITLDNTHNLSAEVGVDLPGVEMLTAGFAALFDAIAAAHVAWYNVVDEYVETPKKALPFGEVESGKDRRMTLAAYMAGKKSGNPEDAEKVLNKTA